MGRIRVGVLGFGALGRHLVRTLKEPEVAERFDLAFVWNRSVEAVRGQVPEDKILAHVAEFRSFEPDLVCEVSHQSVTRRFAPSILEYCDFFAGSSTALADPDTEQAVREAVARPGGHGLYIPRGALPGLEDILRMGRAGKVDSASVTMEKHPKSLHFVGPLGADALPVMESMEGRAVLYDGPLRPLCDMAPSNVNTMAVLAMASGLGFDQTRATLVADSSLQHHIVNVQVNGFPQDVAGQPLRFSLDITRSSPAGAGDVTSTATFTAFVNAMLESHGRGSGMHFV
uniref:Aspartate dehydrogenase domain-containing protein n=1 Tax=Rhizochromulina marina TaxID=1034831 RepID=A0A7S2WU21_9STRA|mmetsp:Transcript_5310/g.15584  ORF Transcript_5310/g.15584 Transcript_5310/m.15584 type:complete len:286 (+) Transcript_5310:25-882(+)